MGDLYHHHTHFTDGETEAVPERSVLPALQGEGGTHLSLPGCQTPAQHRPPPPRPLPCANTKPPPLSPTPKAALYAAPYKSDFLKALSKGQNVTEEECLEKIRLFLVNYTATIDVIYEMYTKMNAELSYKV